MLPTSVFFSSFFLVLMLPCIDTGLKADLASFLPIQLTVRTFSNLLMLLVAVGEHCSLSDRKLLK